MSSDSELQAELTAEQFLDQQDNYFGFACAAVLFYDILLTYDREVICVWKRKFSAATVIFFCVRYATFACLIVNLVSDLVPETSPSCQTIANVAYSTTIVSRISTAGMLYLESC